MKTTLTSAEMMQTSQSVLLTDGEWKFTNLSIVEYLEEMNDESFGVVTYVVWQYFCALICIQKKYESSSFSALGLKHLPIPVSHLLLTYILPICFNRFPWRDDPFCLF